jgi:RNA-directed DNA polymerase
MPAFPEEISECPMRARPIGRLTVWTSLPNGWRDHCPTSRHPRSKPSSTSSYRLYGGNHWPGTAAAEAHRQAGPTGQDLAAWRPIVRDRVGMGAAELVHEPVFEAHFLSVSYGFRPRRLAGQACEAIQVGANRGAEWLLDADVRDCFGYIDHDALLALVVRRASDRQPLKPLRTAWNGHLGRTGHHRHRVETRRAHRSSHCAAMSRPRCWMRKGRAQRAAGGAGRYGDDLLQVRRSRARAAQARWRMPRSSPLWGWWYTGTRRGSRGAPAARKPSTPRLPPAQGEVVALARALLPATMAIRPGHGNDLGQDPGGDRSALRRPVDGDGGHQPQSHPARLGGYFRYGNSARKFTVIDAYVHDPLAIFASTKHRLGGRNWQRRFIWAWGSRLRSTVPTGRCGMGCAYPAMNDVGKPCAGEPHARIELTGATGEAAATVSRNPRTHRETSATEPDHLPLADQPVVYRISNSAVGKRHQPGLNCSKAPRCLPQPVWQGRPRSFAADRRFARE